MTEETTCECWQCHRRNEGQNRKWLDGGRDESVKARAQTPLSAAVDRGQKSKGSPLWTGAALSLFGGTDGQCVAQCDADTPCIAQPGPRHHRRRSRHRERRLSDRRHSARRRTFADWQRTVLRCPSTGPAFEPRNLHGKGCSRPSEGGWFTTELNWLGARKECAWARRSCHPPLGAASSCPRT